MAMNATLDSSNANRRFIILAVVLGLLGAVLVYVAFSRDSSGSGNAISGPSTAVVVAKAEIPARTRITADMVEVKVVPAEGAGGLAFADPAQVVGQVTRFPISVNQQVLSSQIVATDGTGVSRALSYTIPRDKRAFAMKATQIATAGGLILPGDYVDIMVIYGNDDIDAAIVQTLMQNIEILAVSQTIVDTVAEAQVQNGQRPRNSEAAPIPDAATLTLLVTPQQAQTLFLAEANGNIRMTLRAYGDGTEKPLEYLTLPDLLPDSILFN